MNDSRFQAKLWKLERISALILLPLVFFHIVFQYFVIGVTHITVQTISGEFSTGILLLIDVLLLISVVFHGFLGLRGIVCDYTASKRANQIWLTVLGGLAFGAFVYGCVALTIFIR